MTRSELVDRNLTGRSEAHASVGCAQQKFVIGRALHRTRIAPAAHTHCDVTPVCY